MPAAEIIAIGTELLLGEIQDTNTRYLARHLRDAGVSLYRTMVVGDNAERIAGAIREAMARAEIIITTGGLGPTVDDPTRLAVAMAAGVELEFLPELWDQITARFQRFGRAATENNRRQAYVPKGALAVENPVGTAPAFIVEIGEHAIISLPGVPREMEYLYENRVLPYLRERYALKGIIKARVLHSSGVGESWVDEKIGDLETSQNPTVGLLAHAGQVDIRVTAKADTVEDADRMIEGMSRTIRERLLDAIFGEDDTTLEKVLTARLEEHSYRLGLVEYGLEGELLHRLQAGGGQVEPAHLFPGGIELDDLQEKTEQAAAQSGDEILLGVSLVRGAERQQLHLVLVLNGKTFVEHRFYGGPPAMSAAWAANTALDFLRRNFNS